MTYRSPKSIIDLHIVLNILKPISSIYPDFESWYWDKVIPGVILGQDEIIIAENKYEIIGMSIIKKGFENKLRALRIEEKYQKRGLALHLIDESLKRLNVDKPLVSVSEEMINEYSRIFVNKYNFDLTHVYNGLYRKGSLEYKFNGNSKLMGKSIYF